MLKIALNGASGKMGQEILKLLTADNNSCVTFALSRSGKLSDSTPNFYCQDFPNDNQLQTDVMIDFSLPQASLAALNWCVAQRVPLVIGTTGFSDNQLAQIAAASQQIPVLLSANMSLSVNVLFKVSALVAQALRHSEVEISESHHRYKKDAPSGTALKLGQEVAGARGLEFAKVAKFDRTGHDNSIRGADEIGFQVIRGGDIVGKHTVAFITDGEELSLTSEITNRSSFAHGAIVAAKFLVKQLPGQYSMCDALGLAK
jgi:4-hydroxy-tetrahydrodipicolinate reductase